MVPLSRRRLLHLASGTLVGVAGCNGTGSEDAPTPTADVPPAVDYESLVVRNSAGDPFVSYEGDGDSGDDETFVNEPLATADDADRVSFARSVDGVDDARAFLADTDFERDVVFLNEQPVSECRTLAVSYVSTTADSFDVEFCAPLRPADVDCSADRRDVAVALVRFRLATDSVSSYSYGGGRSCRRPPGRRSE